MSINKNEFYKIQDGDLGSTVARGLSSNEDAIADEINRLDETKLSLEEQELTTIQQKQVQQNIAKGGYLRPLLEAAGAQYNEYTKLWSLYIGDGENGLTDITDNEIIRAYVLDNLETTGEIINHKYITGRINFRIRNTYHFTNPAETELTYPKIGFSFIDNPKLEVLALSREDRDSYGICFHPIMSNGFLYLGYYRCGELRVIIGNIYVKGFKINKYFFNECPKLEHIHLYGLDRSITNFSVCPNFEVKDDNKSSLWYMIEYAANTEAITITLHADAFARVPQTLKDKATAKNIIIQSA